MRKPVFRGPPSSSPSHQMSSATRSKTTSDFAHLFELFDQLASRRRRRNSSIVDDGVDVRSIPVPKDLEPVFRSLVSLVGTRHHQMCSIGGDGRQSSMRRKTVSGASTTGNKIGDSDLEPPEDGCNMRTTARSQFPLDGGEYPFTFKMMLHKLYELEEWGKKVKDVLERSQSEYKSLTLQERDIGDGSDSRKGKSKSHRDGVAGSVTTRRGPRIEFAQNVATPSQRRTVALPTAPATMKVLGRPRSHTVAGTNVRAGVTRGTEPPHWVMAATRVAPPPPPPPPPAPQEEGLKAVKKRCIGRRKSLGGKRDWVYDAAVASRAQLDEGRRIPSVGSQSSLNPDMNKNDGIPNPEGGRLIIVRRRVISVATASPWRSSELA
ncbi:hypothetical protein E1B28_007209 [Marasmius oreades]|uniref:Uncharacterized protein n=1 Tax=Marasmius oreades TaxID=181124 RepID=A0A9P7S2W5_9AGAR|nr:uncharacterized protein E1B28_007209 [Marasmius oreades]KAG7093538.1 hypothetical protein E1B28_007209 [Marasmius oreades]